MVQTKGGEPVPDASGRKHHDVFISYAQLDKPIADAICARLESRRIRCWISPRDVPPAKDFPAAIVEGIEDARVVVLVFSSHANNSPHVIRELTSAVNKGRIIIPFRIEDVVPSKSMEYLISVPHWLDAITPPLEKHIEALADTIENILAADRKGTSCPVCGNELDSNARFCESCGVPVNRKEHDLPVPANTALQPSPLVPAPVPFRKHGIVVIGALAAVAIVAAIIIIVISGPVPVAENQVATASPAVTVATTPFNYRSEETLVETVVLTTEPTQALPDKTALNIEVSKDSTNAMVTVLFTGGGGMGLVKDNTVTLTRADGTSTVGELDFNQRLTEVNLQGSRGTDRLQVIVTMKSGATYVIMDRLVPYRSHVST